MAAQYQKKPGYTELIHEAGVSKADARLRVVGAIDEANASLGLAKAFLSDQAKKISFPLVSRYSLLLWQ